MASGARLAASMALGVAAAADGLDGCLVAGTVHCSVVTRRVLRGAIIVWMALGGLEVSGSSQPATSGSCCTRLRRVTATIIFAALYFALSLYFSLGFNVPALDSRVSYCARFIPFKATTFKILHIIIFFFFLSNTANHPGEHCASKKKDRVLYLIVFRSAS